MHGSPKRVSNSCSPRWKASVKPVSHSLVLCGALRFPLRISVDDCSRNQIKNDAVLYTKWLTKDGGRRLDTPGSLHEPSMVRKNCSISAVFHTKCKNAESKRSSYSPYKPLRSVQIKEALSSGNITREVLTA